jgi:hypothetical protein
MCSAAPIAQATFIRRWTFQMPIRVPSTPFWDAVRGGRFANDPHPDRWHLPAPRAAPWSPYRRAPDGACRPARIRTQHPALQVLTDVPRLRCKFGRYTQARPDLPPGAAFVKRNLNTRPATAFPSDSLKGKGTHRERAFAIAAATRILSALPPSKWEKVTSGGPIKPPCRLKLAWIVTVNDCTPSANVKHLRRAGPISRSVFISRLKLGSLSACPLSRQTRRPKRAALALTRFRGGKRRQGDIEVDPTSPGRLSQLGRAAASRDTIIPYDLRFARTPRLACPAPACGQRDGRFPREMSKLGSCRSSGP